MSLTKNKLIQHALGLEIDGVIGPKTVEAIKALQSKNGLVVDGVAGNKTMLYVYAIIAEKEHKELNRQVFFNAVRCEINICWSNSFMGILNIFTFLFGFRSS